MSLDFSSLTQTPSPQGPEALISEGNHRIANNLSVIVSLVRGHVSSIAKKTGSMPLQDVGLLLEDVAGRIEAAGRLHRCIAQIDGPVNIELSSYLRDISNSLVTSLALTGRGRLTFSSATECFVPGREALTIGFVVSELLANAIKYSHPTGVSGNFSVNCSCAGDFVTVEVADDGVGCPMDSIRQRTANSDCGWCGCLPISCELSSYLRTPALACSCGCV